MVDSDRPLAVSAAELVRSGIPEERVLVRSTGAAVLEVATLQLPPRMLALLAWPPRSADERGLVRSLRSYGAYVIAEIPADQWQLALTA